MAPAAAAAKTAAKRGERHEYSAETDGLKTEDPLTDVLLGRVKLSPVGNADKHGDVIRLMNYPA